MFRFPTELIKSASARREFLTLINFFEVSAPTDNFLGSFSPTIIKELLLLHYCTCIRTHIYIRLVSTVSDWTNRELIETSSRMRNIVRSYVVYGNWILHKIKAIKAVNRRQVIYRNKQFDIAKQNNLYMVYNRVECAVYLTHSKLAHSTRSLGLIKYFKSMINSICLMATLPLW